MVLFVFLLFDGLKVEVRNFEIVLDIELRSEGIYIYVGKIFVLGGFLIGLGGKGLVMLFGGIDFLVVVYFMMK